MWFILILGIFAPRVIAALLYFFTSWFTGVFQTTLWPILGFIFMPYTLLWYSVVMNWYQGVWGVFQIVVMVVAVLIDLGSYSRRF